MPTKDEVTEDIIQKSQHWLRHLYDTLLWCHTPSTLLSFIIELYEVLLVSTASMGTRPTDKQTMAVVNSVALKELRIMRNQLSHNIYTVESVFSYVNAHLECVPEDEFNKVCRVCGLPDNAWKDLMAVSALDEHNIVSHIDATPTLLKLHLMSEITGE